MRPHFGSGHAGEITPLGCLGKPLVSTKRAEGRGKRERGLRELKISIHFCRCHPEQQKYSHICVITAPLRGICTKRKLHFMFDLKQTMRLQACLFPVESALLMCLLLRLGVNLSFLTSVSRGPPMMHTTVSLTLCLLSVLLFVFFFFLVLAFHSSPPQKRHVSDLWLAQSVCPVFVYCASVLLSPFSPHPDRMKQTPAVPKPYSTRNKEFSYFWQELLIFVRPSNLNCPKIAAFKIWSYRKAWMKAVAAVITSGRKGIHMT